MKILVTGSLEWSNRKFIRKILEEYKEIKPIIVHGACPDGVDTIADEEAKKLGYVVKPYPAKWKVYQKVAGFIRNQLMLDAEKPDLVLAFQIGNSPGTTDMISRSGIAKVKIRLFKIKKIEILR
jgi:hypothetical protein